MGTVLFVPFFNVEQKEPSPSFHIERVDVRALKKALEDPLLPLVVRVLKKHSDPVLVTTMMQEEPALDEAGFMHVESLIDALIQAGLAEKVIMQRKKFYRLK